MLLKMSSARETTRVVERISLEEMRSRAYANSNSSMSAAPASSDEHGSGQPRISAIPASHRAPSAPSALHSFARQHNISAIPASGPRAEAAGGRILGVYTAQEYAQRVKEREAGVCIPPQGSARETSAAQGTPVHDSTAGSGGPAESKVGDGRDGDPGMKKNAAAYRDLDAVIAGIRKELELNKAEETLTKQVKEQLDQKRFGRLDAEATFPATVPHKLDVLGLKNASLLSQMRAATSASPSNASTVIHSSSASNSQESPARQSEHSAGELSATSPGTIPGRPESKDSQPIVVAQTTAATRRAAPAQTPPEADIVDDTRPSTR